MNFKKKFGIRLKELRKKRNLSQEKFSEMLNIAQNTLSNIETGLNFCTADTIEKILLNLGVTPSELFDFKHFESDENLIDEINEILKNNPDKIKEIYKIIKAIVN